MNEKKDWKTETEWFKTHFSAKDEDSEDEREPGTKRSPAGPEGSNRKTSREQSNLVIIDKPELLDLHLSYSAGLENGPIIQRRGDSSPFMEDPEEPGSYTTDPELQRIGAYYITEEKKKIHIRDIYYRFAANYIIHGQLVGGEQARKDAQTVLLRYCPKISLKDIPFPLNFNPPNLTVDVVNFLGNTFNPDSALQNVV